MSRRSNTIKLQIPRHLVKPLKYALAVGGVVLAGSLVVGKRPTTADPVDSDDSEPETSPVPSPAKAPEPAPDPRIQQEIDQLLHLQRALASQVVHEDDRKRAESLAQEAEKLHTTNETIATPESNQLYDRIMAEYATWNKRVHTIVLDESEELQQEKRRLQQEERRLQQEEGVLEDVLELLKSLGNPPASKMREERETRLAAIQTRLAAIQTELAAIPAPQ